MRLTEGSMRGGNGARKDISDASLKPVGAPPSPKVKK